MCRTRFQHARCVRHDSNAHSVRAVSLHFCTAAPSISENISEYCKSGAVNLNFHQQNSSSIAVNFARVTTTTRLDLGGHQEVEACCKTHGALRPFFTHSPVLLVALQVAFFVCPLACTIFTIFSPLYSRQVKHCPLRIDVKSTISHCGPRRTPRTHVLSDAL